MTSTGLKRPALMAALAAALSLASFQASAQDGQVIELTQTPCQFVEAENGMDHGYSSTAKADCEAINAQSGAERLAEAQTLTLKPGKYVFRVTNKNVPYELGFYLRGDGLVSRATLPSVSGGGLTEGVTKDYMVELTPGEYLYSCPLNPTPDYRIKVEG
ncbi:MAG: hypothetical protein ACFCUQ_07935 [Kiloniellales bacterium]